MTNRSISVNQTPLTVRWSMVDLIIYGFIATPNRRLKLLGNIIVAMLIFGGSSMNAPDQQLMTLPATDFPVRSFRAVHQTPQLEPVPPKIQLICGTTAQQAKEILPLVLTERMIM